MTYRPASAPRRRPMKPGQAAALQQRMAALYQALDNPLPAAEAERLIEGYLARVANGGEPPPQLTLPLTPPR